MNTTSDRVLVAYNGSPDADRGLEWAASYAADRKLTLEVLGCSGDVLALPEGTHQEGEVLEEAWLAKAEERLSELGFSDPVLTRSKERVVEELLRRSNDVRVLVLGARGHGVVAGLMLGSVSQHVTRHAACPVVVVRAPSNHASRRIVVGVDGSEANRHALAFAFEHADVSGGIVVAVHGRSLTAVHGPFDVDISPAAGDELADAHRLLGEALGGLREDYPDVPVEMVPMPVPAARALADASGTAQLVVVGTRGRGGFTGLLLGSVSADVLHLAQCPVAVVR